ncbi:hypothetical protein [Bacillus tuaregi]|uniref:hypothetical protein n=1 Tax=Bacillus tuaregi TaxID=1816695 RepID=UPI0008F81F3F|nr:hypothetical protein [Bacillus tuaregi]
MKRLIVLGLFFSLFLLLVGCNKQEISEEEVKKFLLEYKETQYNIDDLTSIPNSQEIADKSKTYLSREAFDQLNSNRIFDISPFMAKKLNKVIQVQDITLEKVEKNKDSVDYEYNLIIELQDPTNGGSEKISKKGEMTIKREEGQLMIIRDWEEKVKIGNDVF